MIRTGQQYRYIDCIVYHHAQGDTQESNNKCCLNKSGYTQERNGIICINILNNTTSPCPLSANSLIAAMCCF